MLKKVFQMLGMNSAGAAQQLAQYGNPHEIQRAIDSGDTKALSFIEKRAREIQQSNPELFNMAKNMMGMR